MGKLLLVGGMRQCYSPTYTPLGYISRVAMLFSSIYPLGVYFQGMEGAALTRGRAWSPSSLLAVGRGQWEAEGKHRSATGPGGGGGESAAVGLAQCLGDGQTDTGPAVVPTAGAPPVEVFEDVSELARWDALAVIGDVDERGGRPCRWTLIRTCPPAGACPPPLENIPQGGICWRTASPPFKIYPRGVYTGE